MKNYGQQINDGHVGTAGADIRVESAWSITKGDSSIVVAVIDEGVTSDHPDLPNSRQLRLPSSNFASPFDGTNSDDPSPVRNENHGNACAGIIGATHNHEGIAGIAPNCKIMPIRIPGGFIPSSVYATAIQFAVDNGADILSNSWGYAESNPNFVPLIVEEINNAITNGRDGNGCIVTFSAGNTANRIESNYGYITFPANCNNNIVVVGASDRNDSVAIYSPRGNLLSLVAPSNKASIWQISTEASEIWTIDIPGEAGYNPTISSDATEYLPDAGTNYLAYTGRFGGTSAACPQVAGVAALMLSVNPNLTTTQAAEILKRTARKPTSYTFSNDASHPCGTWNNDLGYGVVNAGAAVSASFVDLYTRDNYYDNGLPYIHDRSYAPFNSPDIWVRNQADNGTAHQPALRGATNYVNVRIHNRGGTSSGEDTVKLYIKRAALGVDRWPAAWYPLASAAIPAIAPNGDTVVRIGATFPTGNLLSSFWDANSYVNYAILSRIVSDNDPMSYAEGSNTGMNIINNNNISAKNVVVAQAFPIGDVETEVALCAVENPSDNPFVTNLRCTTPQSEGGRPLWEEAEIRLILDPTLAAAWRATGGTATNLRQENDTTLLVCGAEARLTNFTVPANYEGYLVVQVNFLTQEYSEKTTYEYVISEYKPGTDSLQGSLSVVVEKPLRSYLFEAEASEDPIVTRNTTVTVSADNIGEGAVYNWYNVADSLVGTGESLSFTASATAQYKLEVVATADGYKDYDSVLVVTTLGKITSLTPNPAGGQVTVGYELSPDVTGATLVIAGAANGQTYCTSALSTAQTSQTVSLQAVPAGLYTVRIECQGALVDIKNLIVY